MHPVSDEERNFTDEFIKKYNLEMGRIEAIKEKVESAMKSENEISGENKDKTPPEQDSPQPTSEKSGTQTDNPQGT